MLLKGEKQVSGVKKKKKTSHCPLLFVSKDEAIFGTFFWGHRNVFFWHPLTLRPNLNTDDIEIDNENGEWSEVFFAILNLIKISKRAVWSLTDPLTSPFAEMRQRIWNYHTNERCYERLFGSWNIMNIPAFYILTISSRFYLPIHLHRSFSRLVILAVGQSVRYFSVSIVLVCSAAAKKKQQT